MHYSFHYNNSFNDLSWKKDRMARILITSALPYINGVKHLGNLVGSQLPADTFARFMRLKNHEVLFICATDEHGTPAELAAKEANTEINEFCSSMWESQKNLSDGFSLSFDYFGRSSSKENHALTQNFAKALHDNNLIEEVLEKQIFSLTDNRFLPDRYIEGECPNCGYDKARGDQCESCTKQLEPTDLIEPRSAISGSKNLEIRETKHLYLRQSLMREKLEQWISKKDDWPILTTSIAKKWLNDGEGLKDRGITRDLKWGIPVKKGKDPWPGLEGKVFYVWFDAPIEYIAATEEWEKANDIKSGTWETWWRLDKGAEDVRYFQFMAKDNIPFHTLSFPATIMGSNEPWKLVDFIKGFNWLLYEGGKFSTSQGRGVFMDQALELLPSDYWRWWLLSNAPETSDSDFTWESFQSGVNKDLSDVLGNFVSRITKFTNSKFGTEIPELTKFDNNQVIIVNELSDKVSSLSDHMNNVEIRKACAELRNIWTIGNEYLQTAEPWKIYKENPIEAGSIINFSFNLIYLYSIISKPFIPDTCDRIIEDLGFPKGSAWPEDLDSFLQTVKGGQKFNLPENLFQKISDEERENFAAKFSGN